MTVRTCVGVFVWTQCLHDNKEEARGTPTNENERTRHLYRQDRYCTKTKVSRPRGVCVFVCVRARARACGVPNAFLCMNLPCMFLCVTYEYEGIRCAARTKTTRILKHPTSVTSSGEVCLDCHASSVHGLRRSASCLSALRRRSEVCFGCHALYAPERAHGIFSTKEAKLTRALILDAPPQE